MKIIYILLAVFLHPFIGLTQSIVTADKEHRINEFIALLEKENQLGGGITITEKGKDTYSRTFGVNAEKLDSEITFQIGSVTKMFTAVLVAQLVEKGALKFDTKLENYFPNVKGAKDISIKQMLNHTSGLGDYVVKNDSLFYWLLDVQTEQELLNEIHRQDLVFQPGDSMQYSNSAYYLLARIVEKENRMDFKKCVQKHIATPLGLTLTSAVDRTQDYTGVAPSFKFMDGEWTEIEDFYFPNASGAGDVFSTPSEMNVFLRGLHEGALISTETLKKMLPADDEWFGMGFMKVPFYDHVGVGHGGDTYGTHSVASYFQDLDLAITYCVNAERYPTNEFAIGILNILFDKEFEHPEFSHYNPDRLLFKSYAGTYTSDDLPIDIKIYQENGELHAQGDGQPSFILSPTAEHAFEFIQAGLTIVFQPNEDKMIFNQGGMEFEMMKLK